MSQSDDEGGIDGMFQEPEGYLQPEKPFSYETFKLENGQVLQLRLVGNNPLWLYTTRTAKARYRLVQGHLLWNGARRLSLYLQQTPNAQRLVHDRTILELGAGGGLPSLVCALNDARTVVVTDYPDAELIENLRFNISTCLPEEKQPPTRAEGYLWGASTQPLSQHLPDGEGRFDTLLLADLLFNHSEHKKLVWTIRHTLERTKEAKALVFFTPYRPWLLEKDLAFFETLIGDNGDGVEGQLTSRKLFEEVLDRVMFEEDPGDERLRRTVFGFEVFWADLQENLPDSNGTEVG